MCNRDIQNPSTAEAAVLSCAAIDAMATVPPSHPKAASPTGAAALPNAAACPGTATVSASTGTDEALLRKLANTHSLRLAEYEFLVAHATAETQRLAAALAREAAQRVYGTAVFARGLIELSNFCKNNCYYCGIRAGNKSCERYRLQASEVLHCAEVGYRRGFRTFVLQAGEDPALSDAFLTSLLQNLKRRFPDCAITLSLGERSPESYERLYEAGADRYLLRHETATPTHYGQLHPQSLSFENRMACLHALKRIGYATGCGFMVGSPGQTPAHLARDLKFVEEFKPAMCGIGPFIPHHATPFAHERAGSVDQTCFLLSLLRLMQPNLLLPATTALGTLAPDGQGRGILAGANVLMPNLSPAKVRAKYEIYENKAHQGKEASERWQEIDEALQTIGYRLVIGRGDAATEAA